MKKLLPILFCLLLLWGCGKKESLTGVWNNYDTARSMGSSLELILEENGVITATVGYRQQCEGTFTETDDGFLAEMELTSLYSSSTGRWLSASGALTLTTALEDGILSCTLLDRETGEEYHFSVTKQK